MMNNYPNVAQVIERSSARRDQYRKNMTNSDQLSNKSTVVNLPPDVNQNQAKLQTRPNIELWGIPLNHLSPVTQFLVLCGGVFFFYLMYGYFQELIFRLEDFKPYGWYLTLIQFAYYTVFGLVEQNISAKEVRRIPLKAYGLLAFLTVATMGLSNSSLGYLNYPTQVIFKCCKLIPVLIGSIIIQGKKYGLIDFLACLCMSVGLICFTLADSKVSPTFSMYGVTLISLALCADAVIGNVQEKTMKEYKSSNAEMVLYSYGIGFFYILAIVLVTGELIPAFQFCHKHPLQTYGFAFLFSVSGYLGVNVVLALLKHSGALIAVTVTTCRKAVTMVLSFFFFSKPFTYQYLWSGLIVLFGIYLNVYSKNKETWDATFYRWYRTCILRRSVTQEGEEHIV